MTCFFVATGVRVRTLANIKIKDIDLKNRRFIVKAIKNRKETNLPLSGKLSEILTEFLIYRNYESESEYLFTVDGINKIGEESIYQMLKKYNFDRGIRKCGLHKYRYYYARNYIKNGGDVHTLQLLMTHSDIGMTLRYLDGCGFDLAKNMDCLNPLDTLIPAKRSKAVMIR